LIFRSTHGKYQSLSVGQYLDKSSCCPQPESINPLAEWQHSKTVFQDSPADIFIFYKQGGVDNSSEIGFYYCFQKGTHYYRLGYRSVGSGKTIPKWVYDFFDTFRIEKKLAQVPQSCP